MEDRNFYSTFAGPLCLVTAFICGIAVVSCYIFPKQRKFPNVVLVWTWYALQLLSFSLFVL
jgi:hypothetical protein